MAADTYPVGGEFIIILRVPALAPTDHLMAELTGPVDAEEALQTVLKTSAEPSKPSPHRPHDYVLRGPVPAAAMPGRYGLTGLALHSGAPEGQRPPRNYGKDDLPKYWISITAAGESKPLPPLPRVTKAE
jgi:hypothetical protein